MISPPVLVLGATFGAVAGLLALCCVLCVCGRLYKKKKMPPDSGGGTPVTMTSVLHQGQPMNIYKCTEAVHQQANVNFLHIYGAKETSPEIVNSKNYNLKTTDNETKEMVGPPGNSQEGTITEECVSGDSGSHSGLEKNDLEKIVGFNNVPKLRYSLGYERQAEELCVSFLEAIGPTLPSADNTESYCYVLGTLTTPHGQTEAQTSLIKRAQHTVWEEALVFPLNEDERTESSLTLTLRNCDCFSRYKVAGEITLKLAHVGIPFGTARWVDLKVPEKSPNYSGEILLSASYLPAANRLIVVLIKARNIHSDKYNDLLGKDLLVKINLKHQSKRLKKKQSKRAKHKINPVWNEMIMFEVPPELLKEVSVDLEMVCQEPLERSNRVTGESRTLGKCCLGLDRTGTGKNHWQEMMNNPRRQIAMWHYLQP
ncbi:synaptotagmin-13 isoform X1 [Pelobates cultripes]|uniref:Synaptotagmin-13 isoform X1 n=1 Tax=Pelobates cultripes TaxID=61616 RepID=A0AAD1TFF7_PELCU|nr:synaptotagmin-13 isoform X1 [Pelobates cultripes]